MLKYYTNGYTLPNFSIHGPERVKDITKADVFIVDKGDGSILRGVNYLLANNMQHLPILGVNTGHVGFLSNDITEEQVISFLKNPDWSKIEERSLIVIYIQGKEFFALNEVVIQPVARGPLFEVVLEIDQNKLVYKGDGLIIATPSGSTAYNLSAGGSIVQPNTEVLSITPICPFSLAARPLVISDKSKLTVGSSTKAELTIDGVSVFKDPIQNMRIYKAPFSINLIKFTSFFDAISSKLGWNYYIK